MALSPEVTLSISAEWSKLNTTLNESSRKINSWAAESGGAFKNFEKSVLAFTTRIAAIAAPFAAVGAALAVMAQKTANAGDELYKTSQKIGIGIEKLSGLKYAAELSGVSLDQLTTGIGMLAKNMFDASNGIGEAKDAFKELNIKVTDSYGNLKSTDGLLLELADKFSNMKDGADKTAFAMRIFGKAGRDLIPFFNEGSEGIKKLHEEAKKAGVVFSEDAGKSAEDFNDNITKIKNQINTLVYAIGNKLIRAFNQLIGSGDGVLKIGYAIGGIFQGAASSTLFLSAGIFKIIAGLALLTDKLGLTTNQYARWKEESTLALEASIDLAKQAQGNILDLFIPSSASASTGDNKSIKKSVAPEVVDVRKRETEIAAFLKKSEAETKRHLERLSAMKERQVDENLELEKKSHSEMWGVVQEYNKKMAEADKAGLIDRTGIYEWFRLRVGEIRKKEMQAELDEGAKKNSFIAGLQNQILSAEKELYGEEWALVQDYYQKKVEAAKYGADAELELEKWLVAEMEAVRSKIKPPEPPKPPKKWYGDMEDYTAALGAISSGSLSGIAGLFGEAGKLIGGIIELITNIGKLPDLLKAGLKGLVEGAREFGQAIVTIIKDIIVNLPQILAEIIINIVDSVDEIITALIKGIPRFIQNLIMAVPAIISSLISEIPQLITALIQEIPLMIGELIAGILEGIKAIFTGGEFNSIVSGWTDKASTVTVQLDTSNAMSALKQAQEALLGAVNETDRKVAREALLSARSAAILAEKQGQQTGSQTPEARRFEGIFGMMGNIFNNLWKALEDIFGNAWVGLAAVLLAASILQKAWGIAWLGLKKAWDIAWLGLKKAWDLAWLGLKKAADLVWTGIHWAAGAVWSGIMWGVHGAVWLAGYIAAGVAWLIGLAVVLGPIALIGLAIAAAFAIFNADFQKILSNAWEGLKGIFQSFLDALKSVLPRQMGGSGGAMGGMVTGAMIGAVVGGPVGAVVGGAIGGIGGSLGLWHEGGLIKAHSGMYLKDDDVPIIAQFGEGILNKYKGMSAIGGEAGLNFANRYGSLPGGGSQNITQNITNHNNFEVVVDKDGNVMKLTRTQAKNLARTLDPVFKEMKRNRELSFA